MTHQATGKYINFVYKTVRDKYYNIETFESTVYSFYFDKMKLTLNYLELKTTTVLKTRHIH